MGVQEGDDIPYGHRGAQHAGSDQPFSLLGSEDSHIWELGHIIFQAFLEVFYVKVRNSKAVAINFLQMHFLLHQQQMALEVYPEQLNATPGRIKYKLFILDPGFKRNCLTMTSEDGPKTLEGINK